VSPGALAATCARPMLVASTAFHIRPYANAGASRTRGAHTRARWALGVMAITKLLLLALPSRDLRRLMSHLEHVPCRREQILAEADSSLDHVFFPDSGVVSVMAVYSDGGTIEMATIGREGCAGVQAVFGTSKSSARYWVQIPGSATKISRAAFTRAVRQTHMRCRITAILRARAT
jgi:CRP-like cAMP-binding protein